MHKLSFHFIVRYEGTIVAAARLTLHTSIGEVPAASVYRDFVFQAPSPIGTFGRAVVTGAFRMYGLGTLLDLARYRKAQKIGCNTLITYAHPTRVEILSTLGFEVLGHANMSAYPRWPEEFERVALICCLTP